MDHAGAAAYAPAGNTPRHPGRKDLRRGWLRRWPVGHQRDGSLRPVRQHLVPGQGGLTAVLAEKLDREFVFEAVRNRRIYATTGEKIILEFSINGQPMGSELAGTNHLQINVGVVGTDAIDRIEIVKDLVDTFAAVRVEQNPDNAEGVFVLYDAAKPAGGELLRLADTSRLNFAMQDEITDSEIHSYYVRVTQDNAEQAWSSPIWVG